MIVTYLFIFPPIFLQLSYGKPAISSPERNLSNLLDKNEYARFLELIKESNSSSSISTLKGVCSDCRHVLSVLEFIFKLKLSKTLVAKLVEEACDKLKIQDVFVCKYISTEFEDEVLYVVQQLLVSPDQFCPIVFGDCGSPDHGNPFYNWTIPLPDTPKPPIAKLDNPPAGSPTMRILQITDLHYDLLYAEGSEADCSGPLCCRNSSNSSTSANKTRSPAGYWGSLAKCDIPYRTVESIFKFIADNEKFDAVYWTGDLPPHDVWRQSQKTQLDLYANMTALFKKYFGDKKVFSVVGNHESAPVDSFPPHWDDLPSEYSIDWLYSSLKLAWLNWLPQNTSSQIMKRASYSTLLNEKLRVISLNTNYFDDSNFWILINQTDPDGVMQWFVDELQKAEDAGEHVHILAHEPPSSDGRFWSWKHLYYQIVNRYESTIRGQFMGHEHTDSFRVFWDNSDPTGRLTGSVFVAPSITTFSNHHPTYRIYTVDARPNGTWAVLDYETKLVNITEANKDRTKLVDPHLEYSFKKTYNVENLFPEQLQNLTKTMNTAQGWKYLQAYAKYNQWSIPYDCNEHCLHAHYCDIMVAKPRDPGLCPDWWNETVKKSPMTSLLAPTINYDGRIISENEADKTDQQEITPFTGIYSVLLSIAGQLGAAELLQSLL